jgi:flagellar hook-length control protein FliK
VNSVNTDFSDLAIGGTAAPARPNREEGSAGFGEVLYEALSQGESGKDDHVVDAREPARRGDETDPNEADAEKDGEGDQQSTTDVVNLSATADLMRPMPTPPPPTEAAEMADLSEAFTSREGSTEGATVDAMAQSDAGARQAALNNQLQARRHRSRHERDLADINSELADNLAAKLEQLVEGNQSGAESPIDTRATEREWRRAVIAKLAGMVEPSPSERSGHPKPSRSSAPPAPSAPDMSRILSSIANQSTDQMSQAAKSFSAKGIVEMLDGDRLSSFDRHAAQLNHLRIESSMAAPFRVEFDAASMASPAIDEPAMDADLPEQIVQSIRLQALDLGGEARVRLRPAYLGEVVVSVKVEAGAVTATLQADTAAVRRWIETHETSLRIGLADQGLHLDRLIVSEPSKSESEPGERRRQQQQERPARQGPRRSARNQEEAGTFEVVV